MEGITIKDIVSVTGGILLCGDESKEIKEFSIDSRQGDENSIFVPIIGERVDAHRFIRGALEINGATFTQEHEEPMDGCGDKPWIRVDDTVKAMQQVGTYYRSHMKMPVVAVTGSVGKTTTREMIAEALSAGKNVFQTLGNQNSQIGVPLTLSHMTGDHEAAVLEIGMSERGQIKTLTDMIRPDIAVVTVIGVSHIAQLGSQENICAEKMDIVKGLPEDGMVFLNGDDPFLIPYRNKLDKKVLYYGMSADCDYRAESIRTKDGRTSFIFCYNEDSSTKNIRKLSVTLGTMGEHNVRNALAALGICHQMGVDLESAAKRLYHFHGQRQQVIRTRRCTLIDDTYNASPDSMKASIRVLASMEGVRGRRIAGLSDMLELGEKEKDYHFEVGAFIAGQPIDEVAVYGELSRDIIRGIKETVTKQEPVRDSDHSANRVSSQADVHTANRVSSQADVHTANRVSRQEDVHTANQVSSQEAGLISPPKCVYFDTREELKDYLLKEIRPEDVLLLKGSNGMKLKEISEAIQLDEADGVS